MDGERAGVEVLLELQRLAVVDPLGLVNLLVDAGELAWPGAGRADGDVRITARTQVMDEQVRRSVGIESEIVALALDPRRLAVVDGVGVHADPIAAAAQGGGFVVGDGAFGRGADVEQVVGTDLAAGTEVLDDLRRAHVGEVVLADPPVPVHRLAHLAGHVLRHPALIPRRGAALLEGDRVDLGMPLAPLMQARVVDDDRFRLVASDHRVQLIFLPVGLLLAPVAVEPESADRAVVGAEDLDRLVEIVQVGVEVRC